MTKTIALTERDVKMLELLAQGDPSKEIARKLGYRAGTMRVYLHDLYRKLHVSNKTAAVVWYFGNFRAPVPAHAAPREDRAATPAAGLEETMGEMALRTDLFTALGAMSTFIGPFGRLWQVAARLKGTRLEGDAEHRARRARVAWEALLTGDFAAGKKRYDQDPMSMPALDSSPERLVLAVLLVLGGYSSAAERVIGQAPRTGKRLPGMLTVGERDFLSSLRAVVEQGRQDGLAALHRAAAASSPEPLRHIAMAALHHVYRIQGVEETAARVAEALWAEAESSEQQLEAMGERPLYRHATVPAVPSEGRHVRRKETVGVR
ncbi:MAG TPA: helix-turn-helix transcriptional regulator [Usitatibacter sp.]|jgi:DNA-binding CsgD family transcriptional regulator|nr:helix-turn-helix transcriptional regulator [Usitatibacter sp.]